MSSTSLSNGADGLPPRLELDVSKLHSLPSEQQDLYLLTFSADLAKQVNSLDADGVVAHQVYFKNELFKIISLASPTPTRVIRNNLERGLAGLFRIGDRKLLYETINGLLGIINAAKGEKDLNARHAAVQCLGAVYEAAGDSAITLSGVSCQSALRLLKNAQNHAGLRNSIFKALSRVVGCLGNSLDESVARDIWKLARATTSADKSFLTQIRALWCLENLVKETSYFLSPSDFESFEATIFKSIDSPSSRVRHAAASAFASALISSFSGEISKNTVQKPKKLKRVQKKESNEADPDDETQKEDSPSVKKLAKRMTLSFSEILRQISTQYARTSTSNRARAGLGVTYIRLFKGLNRNFVETNYMMIADHLLTELNAHQSITCNRYRLLTTRKFVRVILEMVIGQEILGETAQINAIKALVNHILKNYPQVIKERPEPSKYTITGALSAIASLLNSLGAAANIIAELCRDGLLQVLQHPSYTVQISTSHCLRTLALVCPQQLLPCASICMNNVSREIGLFTTPRRSPRKCVGSANGLAAVLSTAPMQPIHGSVEVNMRVLSLATDLLKSSGESELRTSSTQIQVAWILLGGLMSFGPSLVKGVAPQLLLLWKNALPKPLPKESMEQKSLLELSFLAHVRECALGCMLAFLEHNSRLLTTDMVRRLAVLLQNTTLFLNHLPSAKTTEDISQRLSPSLQLQDFSLMVRRRVLQLYTTLLNVSPAGVKESLLQPDILTLTLSLFADPEAYTSASLNSSIANSVGNFESIWEVGDNYGFGITGLIRGLRLKRMPGEQESSSPHHWLIRNGPTYRIDQALSSPVAEAPEHDSVSLYVSSIDYDGLPSPPATEVVNAAIKLFAVSLPLQPAKVQESILEQMATMLSATPLQRDPARKAAMTVNVAVALLITLKVAVKETSSSPGDLTNAAVERIMQNMLRGFIVHPDLFVRNLAYEGLGRLCSSSGNTFTANEVKNLIDIIVSNREPSARAGCAVALGCIHSQVGGMAAGYHLKTIFGILLSLSEDPHPLVHFWTLEGLSKVADSAGLTFSGFVSSSLGMLAQRYYAETHNEEAASAASSNLEVECPTTAVIARCLDSLVNVLGPDLQDMHKVRELILTITGQLATEDEPLVIAGNLRCFEHMSLYAAEHMDYSGYVRSLQSYLNSPEIDVRNAVFDGLYSLMKRGAERVINNAESGFEDQLWMALDGAPLHEGLRNIIKTWLHQTCLSRTDLWIQRFQSLMNRTRSEEEMPAGSTDTNQKGIPDLRDEEVAGFAAASASDLENSKESAGKDQELLRWQVRAFTMECLSELLAAVEKDMLSSDSAAPAGVTLQEKIADVIRIAFAASTAQVLELRIWGLRIIDQVLKIFGRTPDPDFPEASLLDQYQAQFTSALTPAFAADSSPELAAEAVDVCAAFIATGIVTNVERMGRILRLLISALGNISDHAETVSIGDLKNLSSNAQIMVKVAVISAWAKLQVASKEQRYLVNVVNPHKAQLTTLWLSSLRDYARLRHEPDSSSNSSASLTGKSDMTYSEIGQETLLKFYKDSWLNIMDAISGLIEEDIAIVFEALDGGSDAANANDVSDMHGINYRDEPVAFFFVLYGIVFETLLARSGSGTEGSAEDTVRMLNILRRILRPSVSGQAVYEHAVFSELMEMLNRLAMTQGLEVQALIVEIARDLCVSHPLPRSEESASSGEEGLSDQVDQVFELTRVIVLVLTGLLPKLADAKSLARQQMSEEAMTLITASFGALVRVADVFPSIIRADLYACIFHVFSTILGTGLCQSPVVPQVLPVFKDFVQAITQSPHHMVVNDMIISELSCCLKRFLVISERAQQRRSEISVICTKNAHLASTMLLTAGTNIIPPSNPSIDKFLDGLVYSLTDPTTSTVAANCIRSLLLHTPRTATDEHIIRTLFPRLLVFLTSIPTNPADTVTAPIRTLIARSLTTLVPSLPSARIPLALSLILPALVTRALKEGPNVYAETSMRLLELAGANQAAFKEVINAMEPEQRGRIERIIREGGRKGRGEAEDDEDDDEEGGKQRLEQTRGPSITLKMSFGA